MDGTFVVIRELAIVIVALLGGGSVVPVVNWIKKTLNLHGFAAMAVAVLMSVLLGLAGLIAEGRLTPESVRFDNLSEWFLLIFLASQTVFRMLQNRQEARLQRIRQTIR